MRASARSRSSRLEVRPAARSRASWATVHMGREYYALEHRNRTLRRQLLSLPGRAARAPRRRNVRGAFRCTGSLDGATVAVVDDVMTTGATLDEIARTLKGAGAAQVVNWVVARTMPHD